MVFLEPEFRDKDVNVDDVSVRDDPVRDIIHGQLQNRARWANQRLHLSDNTHNHAMLNTLNDVKRVVDVSLLNVIDEFWGVHMWIMGWGHRSQENDFFWFVELSEGG